MIHPINPRVQYIRTLGPSSVSQVLKDAHLTTEKIESLLYHGAIYCNGLRLRQEGQVNEGDVLRIHLDPKKFLAPGAEWIPEILFQDEDLLVLLKPGGLPTHPTLDNFNENAKCLAEKYFRQNLYVTHRLDIPTSGALMFTKNPEAQRGVNKMFAKRRIQKIYRAAVEKPVNEGAYIHYLNPKSKTPKEISSEPQEGWLECKLKIRHLDESKKNLEIELETGRTHQIRAQLKDLGSSILGDVTYGAQSPLTPQDLRFVQERIALECFQLSFMFRSRSHCIRVPVPRE